MYVKSVLLFSKMYDYILKGNPLASPDLINACNYLGKPKGFSQKIVKASLFLSLTSFLLMIIPFFMLLNPFVFLIPVAINHFYSGHLKSKYYSQRIKDFGHLPDYFTALISSLKINPNLEVALMNVSKMDYGMASRISKKIMHKANSGADINVKDEFLNGFSSLNDSRIELCANSIISAMPIKSAIKRNLIFSEALNQLLESIKNNAELFSRKMHSSVMMIFGVGTVIPLVLISIFPLAGMISGSSLDSFTLFFALIFSSLVVFFIVNDLKKKSPSKFSQVTVDKKRRGINPFLVFLALVAFSFPSIIIALELFLDFSINSPLRDYFGYAFFASASIILGLKYYFESKSLIAKKRKIQSIEDSLIDSFMVIGSRINEGRSIESSIKSARDNSKGELKAFFSRVYLGISSMGLELKEAFDFSIFFDEMHSKRVLEMSNLLAFTAKRHSASAGEAMIEMCNYYRKIKGVEFEMDSSLSKNTDMIRMTMLFFSPIVCALIINISGLINSFASSADSSMFFSFEAVDLGVLGLFISSYLLILTFVLSDFYSFLKHGDDALEKNFELSKSLAISFLAFTATLIISRFLLFKL